MMSLIVSWLGQSAVTVLLLAIAAYLARNILQARLTRTVQHEFDTRLAEFQSRLEEKAQRRESVRNAYNAILEALHHVREHADTNLAFEIRRREFPPAGAVRLELPAEGATRLERNLQQAMADLRRYRDIGSFVVSEEAISALNHFFTELDGSLLLATDIVEHFEAKVVAIDKCLDEIRRIANKDLSPR
jgi:hypothetical protein